ncbi:MAG: type II toxin-antitoxin system PemK/MazF family toxin [Minisyncoccota bacterium]
MLNDTEGTALFHEREVWWCALGVNIGFEQDGGQEDFERPVVVLKKFNLDACLIVPLTGRQKEGKYYFPVGRIEDREAVAVLSQVRFIDRKRLENKICTLKEDVFRSLVQSVIRASFSL